MTAEHTRNPVSCKSPEGYLARSVRVIVVVWQVAWKQTYCTPAALFRCYGTPRPNHHSTDSLSRELVDRVRICSPSADRSLRRSHLRRIVSASHISHRISRLKSVLTDPVDAPLGGGRGIDSVNVALLLDRRSRWRTRTTSCNWRLGRGPPWTTLRGGRRRVGKLLSQ